MMRIEFESREDFHDYLRSEFPAAAAVDDALSPTRGGRAAAMPLLSQIDPDRYSRSRNFLNGNVTRLSAYIRHGIVSLSELRLLGLAKVRERTQAAKFITELAWRDYWQRLYATLGNGVWQDREPYKTGHAPSAYGAELPPDIAAGKTGLACMDGFVQELRTTGYMHNHARMWFAAYVVHFRRVDWKAGARFFLSHLLDGDPASNNLSWQWVASTFAHKPYFFNRENLERYTGSRYCDGCGRRDDCPFEASYEELEARLFQIL